MLGKYFLINAIILLFNRLLLCGAHWAVRSFNLLLRWWCIVCLSRGLTLWLMWMSVSVSDLRICLSFFGSPDGFDHSMLRCYSWSGLFWDWTVWPDCNICFSWRREQTHEGHLVVVLTPLVLGMSTLNHTHASSLSSRSSTSTSVALVSFLESTLTSSLPLSSVLLASAFEVWVLFDFLDDGLHLLSHKVS